MSELRRVSIEKLAPTGEGVTRGPQGVGFVAGALPGEEVDARVFETRRSFWRGGTVSVISPSRHRRIGGHASGCAACDWAHFDLSAAREAKRELFLETMARIGKVPAGAFGELPVLPSPPGYRLRNRFHVSGRGEGTILGHFAPGTHRVLPADGCEAITSETRAVLPVVRDVFARSGAAVSEFATLETQDGTRRTARVTIADPSPRFAEAAALLPGIRNSFAGVRVEGSGGSRLAAAGESRLPLFVGDRVFSVGVDTFFQANRYLITPLYEHVRWQARRLTPGTALDAFGGAGFFAGALLDAGHTVTSVEADPRASRDARAIREVWPDRERWRLVEASVASFLPRAPRHDLAVADPPRAGLGTAARSLARIAGRKLIYVSCDPATLARDLAVILPEGFEIEDARLYDLFALTHRIEAVVSLTRKEAS